MRIEDRTAQDLLRDLAPSRLCVILVLALMCTGCAGGRLALRSAERDERVLVGNFSQSIYGFDDRNTLHVLLIEGDPQSPSQAVHVEMYWAPRAGRTPIDPLATNAVIRYIVFTGEGAGIYGGAGYLFPHSKPGGGNFRAEVRSSSLRLQDASAGFADRLGLATATGEFLAQRDDLGAQRLLRQLRLQVHQRLGYPKLVLSTSSPRQ